MNKFFCKVNLIKYIFIVVFLTGCTVSNKSLTQDQQNMLRCRSFAAKVCESTVGMCFVTARHECLGLLKQERMDAEIHCSSSRQNSILESPITN